MYKFLSLVENGKISKFGGENEDREINQILLITDGCSNQGEDPIAMAALANEQGITVNVIGVIDQDVIDEKGVKEIEGISMAGNGVSQIVYALRFHKLFKWLQEKQ